MSQYLAKLTKYIPLWQRNIPPYPVYYKGNPQLRVYLPLFWMKLIKSEKNLPQDTVLFEVHHQMTHVDVKNYLEKIYDVKVLSAKCTNIRGETRTHPRFGFDIQPGLDKRIAFVQLDGEKFEFPDIFKGKETDDDKAAKDMKKNATDNDKVLQQQWSKLDIPPWFR